MRILYYKKFLFLIYVIVLAFFILLISTYNPSKASYIKYKNYEKQIDKEMDSIASSDSKTTESYYANNCSKIHMLFNTEKCYLQIKYLYSNFSWDSGDSKTRELYLIKKQIILNYVELYKNKFSHLINGKSYTDDTYMKNISNLKHDYTLKDAEECEKLNIHIDDYESTDSSN